MKGAVRTYKLLSDGRRQIGAFHLPGDIFAFENGGVHRFTAEAVTQSTVCLIKRHTLDAIAQTDAVVWRTLLSMTSEALNAYGWRIALLLGAATLPFGLWLRSGLPETLHRPEAHVLFTQPGGQSRADRRIMDG